MYEEACRPVLFEQDDEYAPYWGKGSSILIANSNHYYWVTAEHVIKSMGGSSDSVRIFPCEASRISLPFNEQYKIENEHNENDDYKDLFVIRVDLDEFIKNGDAPITAQDIDVGVIPAESINKAARLQVIGYPAESRAVDYDDFKIKYKREIINAEYTGKSNENNCHTLKMSDSVQINDYDGLSGSPVFYMKETVKDGRIVIYPLLTGLLLRGSAESRVCHFVSVNVLLNIIEKAEESNA